MYVCSGDMVTGEHDGGVTTVLVVTVRNIKHQVLKKAIKRKDYIVIKDIPYKNGNECQKLLY